jgi:redox-sensitive bicupin YhaK (pirin superfamily)
MHKDSRGAASIIKARGVQWMTAGSGLIHAEIFLMILNRMVARWKFYNSG